MCIHPSAPPGFDFSLCWPVYMHVTELHVCKCTTWYSKRFFVINTTLTCIMQMIIWLCENACIYALGVQRVKPASQLITTLLKDLMVHCIAFKRDVKAEDYHTHDCSTSPTKGEVKMASQVLCRLADTSPEKYITISTGGTQ